jgi:hypothetical protein
MSNSREPIWKNFSGDAKPQSISPAMFDLDQVEALLIACARASQTISYSSALMALGYSFSRPKMRALCIVLGTIDQRAKARGEPELAVLVVRESDSLPGQGWWVGRNSYKGLWEGAQAISYIRRLQQKTFRYWRKSSAGKGAHQ